MVPSIQAVSYRQEAVAAPQPTWQALFKTGGWAAVVSLVFFPIQIAVFMLRPMPTTIVGWFELLHDSPLVGLVHLDLLLMVDQVLIALILLALFVALRRMNPSLVVIAGLLGLISVALFISADPAFGMLSLSDQYFAATGEAQRTSLLGAGGAMIALWQGSAFQASYILGSIAPVLFCLVMLRSRSFGRATAILGIVSNVVALGLYVPVIGIYISVFSVVFLWVWYLLVARDLFRLGRMAREGVE